MLVLVKAHAFMLLLLWTLVLASGRTRVEELESSSSLIEAFLRLELESVEYSQPEVVDIPITHLPQMTPNKLKKLASSSKLEVITTIHTVIKTIPAWIHERRWERVKPWTNYLLDLPEQDPEICTILLSKGLSISFLQKVWNQLKMLSLKSFSATDYEYLVAAGFSDFVFEFYWAEEPEAHPISLVELLDITKKYQEESFVTAVADIVDTLTVLQIKSKNFEPAWDTVCKGYLNFQPLCRSTYMALIFAHVDMGSHFDYFIMGLENEDIDTLKKSIETTLTENQSLCTNYLKRLKKEHKIRQSGKQRRPFIMLD